jgi:hypothetical protein
VDEALFVGDSPSHFAPAVAGDEKIEFDRDSRSRAALCDIVDVGGDHHAVLCGAAGTGRPTTVYWISFGNEAARKSLKSFLSFACESLSMYSMWPAG